MFGQRHAIGLSLAVFCALSAVTAHAFETKAKAAYGIDQTTGTLLLSKQAEIPLPPASMSKLMTVFMAFEAIRDGRLRWDEKLPVSQHAMNYRGSTMFLNTNDRVTVEDLVRGVIVLSGNDASAVLAEALSFDGTEKGFAQMMTTRARELGMNNSTFANSNGWPNPNQQMSMKDLAILADQLISDFPAYYPMFAEREFPFDGRAPANKSNRNPLLGLGLGADGLKTGHTNEAGYGLVGSAKQGDRRIVFVISGLDSAKDRATESERVVTWAFRNFKAETVVEPDTRIAEADVWMGKKATVGLTSPEAISVLKPLAGSVGFTSRIEYDGPIEAPIAKGDVLGELVINADGLPETRFPMVAIEEVRRGGFIPRMRTAAGLLRGMVTGQLGAN